MLCPSRGEPEAEGRRVSPCLNAQGIYHSLFSGTKYPFFFRHPERGGRGESENSFYKIWKRRAAGLRPLKVRKRAIRATFRLYRLRIGGGCDRADGFCREMGRISRSGAARFLISVPSSEIWALEHRLTPDGCPGRTGPLRLAISRRKAIILIMRRLFRVCVVSGCVWWCLEGRGDVCCC